MVGHEWIITIWCAPHSTGDGYENDQKKVGARIQRYPVDADGIDNAMKLANAIKMGIESNPMVWNVEIIGVIQKEYAGGVN
jgi:hypothetical protein